MAYKYYKSDFALLVTIRSTYTDSQGNSVGINSRVPFRFKLYSPLNGTVEDCYEASCIGGVLKNCSILDDKRILVFVDLSQHDFRVGELMLETEWIIDDTHYEGDQENNIKRLYNTGVLLTDKPDLDSEGILEFGIDNGYGSELLNDMVTVRVNDILLPYTAAIASLNERINAMQNQ